MAEEKSKETLDHSEDRLSALPSAPPPPYPKVSLAPIYAAPSGIPPAPPTADDLRIQTTPATAQQMRIYSSTVEIPSVYTEKKRAEYGTWRYFIRKISGIPFAIAYGFFLVWIISDYIFDQPSDGLKFTKLPPEDMTKNVCASFYPRKMPNDSFGNGYTTTKVPNVNYQNPQLLSSRRLRSPRGQSIAIVNEINMTDTVATSSISPPPIAKFMKFMNEENQQGTDSSSASIFDVGTNNNTAKTGNSIIFSNDSLELILIVGAVMTLLGISSIFSRNIKATMLLILPGLITRHARHLIFTIVWGVLSTGPMTNMMYNFNKLLEDAGCMYKYVVFMACIKQKEFAKMRALTKEMYGTFMKMVALIGASWPKNKKQFPLGNSSWDIIQSLTAPSTEGIKNMAAEVITNFNVLFVFFGSLRKILTIVTMVLLVIDAIRYLRSYYIDSSFDNMYIGRSTRRYWKSKDYYKKAEPFTHWNIEDGLRRWEINEGFKTLNLPKCTRKALTKVLRNCFSTLIFFAFVVAVLGLDHFLAEALEHVKNSESLNVTLRGVRKKVAGEFNFEMVEYSTRSCLKTPHYTSMKDYWIISLLMSAAAVSCVFEVFMSGLRARLCGLFYPDRAQERADYLYYKIFTGRLNRKYHLRLIVRREIERRLKLARFSPLERLKAFLRRIRGYESRKIRCPACGWKERSSKAKDLSFDVEDRKVNTKICRNCDKDGNQGYAAATARKISSKSVNKTSTSDSPREYLKKKMSTISNF